MIKIQKASTPVPMEGLGHHHPTTTPPHPSMALPSHLRPPSAAVLWLGDSGECPWFPQWGSPQWHPSQPGGLWEPTATDAWWQESCGHLGVPCGRDGDAHPKPTHLSTPAEPGHNNCGHLSHPGMSAPPSGQSPRGSRPPDGCWCQSR